MSPPPLTRILLVDDEPDMQRVARLALEAVGGFDVLVRGSAEEILEEFPEPAPDLILMDVVLPGMDGPTAFRALRRRKETSSIIPVVFMTARNLPRKVEQYREMGALGVISKPFDPMTLAERVRKIWDNHSESPGHEAFSIKDLSPRPSGGPVDAPPQGSPLDAGSHTPMRREGLP